MSSITPTQAIGIECLFQRTPPYVGVHEGTYRLQITEGLFDSVLAATNPDTGSSDMLNIVYDYDLVRRGVLNEGDIEYPPEIIDSFKAQYRDFTFDMSPDTTPVFSRLVAANLAVIAITRPKGLIIPNKDRLHKSDLKVESGREAPVGLLELTRYRVNFLHNLRMSLAPTAKERRSIGNNGEPEVSAALYLKNNFVRSKPVMLLLARMCGVKFLDTVLPIIHGSTDESESIREEILRRSFDIIKEKDLQHAVIGKYEMPISESAARHILHGDGNGGGHTLHLADSQHVVIQSNGEPVPASRIDGALLLPTATVSINGGAYRRQAFFPEDWNREKILEAITKPHKLLISRAQPYNPDTYEQVYEYGGMIIKRILGLNGDGEPSVITAFPLVPGMD